MKFGTKFFFSGAVFHSIVTNFITEIENTPEKPFEGFDYGSHYENVDEKATIYGYETSFNTQISKNIIINSNISGAWNYGNAPKMEKDANGVFQPVVDANGEKIMDEKVLIGDMAPIKVNFGILYNYADKISIYPKVNFVSVKKTINWRANPQTSPIFTEIQSYAIIGLNINFINTFGLVKGLDINVKLDNLTNETYYNPGARSANGTKYMARVLQPGFNFMAGLSYSLK